MSRVSTVKTILTTLAVALGVGFVVQYDEENADASHSPAEVAEGGAVRTLMMSTNALGEAVFGVPDVVTTPIPHFKNVQAVMAVDAVYMEFAVPQMGTILASPVAGCSTQMSAMLNIAAMVDLSISLPCAADTDFVLRHDDLIFTGRTDDDGNAALTVPALAVDATFAVLIDNVEQARVTLVVPDVLMYDRAVLQWTGTYNVQLHALESGASIGDSGHVWSASVHTAAEAITGKQGFVVRLGTTDADVPQLAEVYTYPAGRDGRDTPTVLQMGVTVTETNCGREVDAMTIQTNSGQSVVARKIAAALPGCDSVGKLAMLRDKFEDITLALR